MHRAEASSESDSADSDSSASSSQGGVFSFKAASLRSSAQPSTSAATTLSASTAATVPSSPGTPSSPAGLTNLRKLPFPNRLLQALPEYLNIPTSSHAAVTPHNRSGAMTPSSSRGASPSKRPSVHPWLRLPLAVLTHMTPANSFRDPLSDAVGDADKATAVDEQTLVDRIQQEKMRQEAQAALDASDDLAQGQSTLLGNASGGGGDSTTPAGVAAARSSRRMSTPMLATSVRSQRAMSLPHALPPLTLQHATLSSVLAAAQSSSKRKVTFSSLLHKLPHPSLRKMHHRSRTASFSHPSSEPVTATNTHSTRSHTPSASSNSANNPSAAHSASPLSRLLHAPSRLARSVLRRVSHICREALFMLHLAAILLSQLGLFGRWAFMAFRLFLFACVLCLAWAKIGYGVLLDRRTIKGLQYGPFNRNFLDLYLPTKVKGSILTPHTQTPAADDPALQTKHPVFIYVTGGAWIIGCEQSTHAAVLGSVGSALCSHKRCWTTDCCCLLCVRVRA